MPPQHGQHTHVLARKKAPTPRTPGASACLTAFAVRPRRHALPDNIPATRVQRHCRQKWMEGHGVNLL